MTTSPPSEENLCNRCREFDFKAIFDTANGLPPAAGRPIEPLIESIAEDTTLAACALCRLFAALEPLVPEPLVPDWSYGGRGFYLRAWTNQTLVGRKVKKRSKSLAPMIVLSLERGNGTQEPPYKMNGHQRALIMTVTPADIGSRAMFSTKVRPVDPDRADFQRLRQWLSDCDSKHEGGCRSQDIPLNQIPIQKLIDCDSMAIVSASSLPGDVRYYALSYVWGTPLRTSDKTEDLAELSACGEPRFAKVVQDAMEVVKKLECRGSRYLWVDRHCVPQQDHSAKTIQLMAMDRVYEKAYATIIAASGNGACSGLPGVDLLGRRMQMPTASVNGVTLVSALPSISTVIEDTVWNTRGWTYQEAMLSRRCIIFTDWQMYFTCRTSIHRESVEEPLNRFAAEGGTLAMLTDVQRYPMGKPTKNIKPAFVIPADDLGAHVNRYSQRKLSYESDALDAFRGILARVSHPTYWGLPIRPYHPMALDACFAEELAWNRDPTIEGPPLRRRLGLPSWSWAGWAGPINLQDFRSMPMDHLDPERIQFDVKVSVVLPCQSALRLADICPSRNASKVIDEPSQELLIQAYFVTLQFQSWEEMKFRHREERSARVCVCIHHLTEVCTDCAGRRIYFDVYLNEPGGARSFGGPWDAMLLPDIYKVSHWTRLLILDRQGDFMLRAGLIDDVFNDFEKAINELPRTWRTIRLV